MFRLQKDSPQNYLWAIFLYDKYPLFLIFNFCYLDAQLFKFNLVFMI